jgi:hypothetical protein
VVPTENMNIRHQYHKWVHLGTGHSACIWCLCGLWAETLRLAVEQPWPSSLVMGNDQVIPAQCEGLVMARFESTLGVENGLIEPSLEAHAPKGLYIARILVWESSSWPTLKTLWVWPWQA